MFFDLSYSVVSVAAVDSTKTLAGFSQRNAQVELAGPGVDVRSTYPEGTALEAQLSVNSVFYDANPMSGSGSGAVSAEFADCGLAIDACNDVADKVCLISRGEVAFSQKVESCQAGGGLAAVIYNNVAGNFSGTVEGTTATIPAVSISQEDGQMLMTQLGSVANLISGVSNYGLMSGTSMASPHVAGVAALVWSHFPQCTNAQIRNVLAVTAEDLGTAGRGNSYGFGLVRAKAAYDYINQQGCDGSGTGGGTNPPPPAGNELEKAVAKTNLTGATGSATYFTITVPAGATNLSFTMSGGSGDADLYVRFGSQPTTSSYDCRPYKGGNAENCSFATPQAGVYHVMISGYSAYAGVSLVADYTAPAGGGSAGGGGTLENLSATRGNWLHYTITVPAGMSSLTATSSGGTGDADLYVRRGSQPTTTTYDCRPYKTGSNESCSFSNPQAAVYHISLRAYSSFSGLKLVVEYKP